MKSATFLSLGLLAMVLIVGCTNQPTPMPKGGKKITASSEDGKKAAPHAHEKGPNGGVVFDLGKYHAEFTVNHDKKECSILMLGADEKTVVAVAAKEFSLTTKEAKTRDGKTVAPMTIKLLPIDEKDGKATKFVGSDPGLGNVADFEGTVVGEIDGKPSQGEFKD